MSTRGDGVSVCAPVCAQCECVCFVCLGVLSCLHPSVPCSISLAPILDQPKLPQPEGPPSPPVLVAGPDRLHWEGIAAPKPFQMLQLLLWPADFPGKMDPSTPTELLLVLVVSQWRMATLSLSCLLSPCTVHGPAPPSPNPSPAASPTEPGSHPGNHSIFPGRAKVGWAGRAAGPGPRICCAHGLVMPGASEMLAWELPCP